MTPKEHSQTDCRSIVSLPVVAGRLQQKLCGRQAVGAAGINPKLRLKHMQT